MATNNKQLDSNSKRSREEIDDNQSAKKLHLELEEESQEILLNQFIDSPSIESYDKLIGLGSEEVYLKTIVDAATKPQMLAQKSEDELESTFLLAYRLIEPEEIKQDDKNNSHLLQLLKSISTIEEPKAAWIPLFQQKLITRLYNRNGVDNSELYLILKSGVDQTFDLIWTELKTAIPNFEKAFEIVDAAGMDDDDNRILYGVETMKEIEKESYKASRAWYTTLLMQDLNLDEFERVHEGKVRDYITELDGWMIIGNRWRPWNEAFEIVERTSGEYEGEQNMFFNVTGMIDSVLSM